DFSKEQRDWKPDIKSVWSKKVRELLGPCLEDTRQKIGFQERVRALKFAPLGDCRRQFALRAGAPTMEWEVTNEEDGRADAAGQINHDADRPAKLQTTPDAPTLAPEADAALGLATDGAASPAPDQEPAQDELDGQLEPVEEEPEDIEW